MFRAIENFRARKEEKKKEIARYLIDNHVENIIELIIYMNEDEWLKNQSMILIVASVRKYLDWIDIDELAYNEYADCFECRLCASNGISKVTHSDGDITTIDPEGGPQISVNSPLLVNGMSYIVSSINFNEDRLEYCITLEK